MAESISKTLKVDEVRQ